jgi:hypothetical protein
MSEEHFPGCHPEDARVRRELPDEWQPGDTEGCWHCGTATPRGCDCDDCGDGAFYQPPTAVYHCPVCRRWWVYLWPLAMAITFDPEQN